MRIFGDEKYKQEVERICNSYKIPEPIKHYFKSLPISKNPKVFEINRQALMKGYEFIS